MKSLVLQFFAIIPVIVALAVILLFIIHFLDVRRMLVLF